MWLGQRDKQCLVLIFSRLQILLQMNLCPSIEVHDPFLVSFAEDDALAFCKVYIVPIELYQFSNSYPCRRQQVNDGQVSYVLALVS